MLACPFCGAPESDRFDVEGRRFVVFPCMFSPEVDPAWTETELVQHLATDFRPGSGNAYFRSMCDRLHHYVTAGAGGDALKSVGTGPESRPSD